jgi:hypothetical protein
VTTQTAVVVVIIIIIIITIIIKRCYYDVTVEDKEYDAEITIFIQCEIQRRC